MNKFTKYEVTDGINEIFETAEAEYIIIDYNFEMDNVESLKYFAEYSNINPDNIENDYGTQLILIHPDYNFKLCVDSGGLGDFFSHKFTVSIWNTD
jgi:hypothetical protein